VTLRAALIGCGKIGSLMADDPLLAGDVFTHAEAYVRSPASELVAVCDADPVFALRCAERWGVASVFHDVATMLAEAKPDVVSICTPDATHYSVARDVIDRGSSVRAVLCEKPLATSLEEAERLVAVAREKGKLLAVAYMRRYAANINALRAFLSSGQIGAIEGATGWYTKGVLHNGSHWFDLLRMLAGEVVWVEAQNTLREETPDPTLDVSLGLENGALATLRAARADNFTLFEMNLVTERGRVQITDSGHAIAVQRAAPSPRYSGYVELAPDLRQFGDRRDQLLHAVNDLASALAEGRAPACVGEDGLAASRIGAAAIEAARSGRRVEIPQSTETIRAQSDQKEASGRLEVAN